MTVTTYDVTTGASSNVQLRAERVNVTDQFYISAAASKGRCCHPGYCHAYSLVTKARHKAYFFPCNKKAFPFPPLALILLWGMVGASSTLQG